MFGSIETHRKSCQPELLSRLTYSTPATARTGGNAAPLGSKGGKGPAKGPPKGQPAGKARNMSDKSRNFERKQDQMRHRER